MNCIVGIRDLCMTIFPVICLSFFVVSSSTWTICCNGQTDFAVGALIYDGACALVLVCKLSM